MARNAAIFVTRVTKTVATMAQHFLLSAKARTLSVVAVARMTEE